MKNFLYLFSLLLLLSNCATKPKGVYILPETFKAPDYSNPEHWAALPDKKDLADRTPEQKLEDNQSVAEVDVFFLHPTTYTGAKGEKYWNGPIDDPQLNTKTDKSTILNQASIFNGAGRVFAPRYRQAHLKAYYAKNKADAQKAFALAYSDIKNAFEYYLEHYNEGRPIIIASHSQGTTHAGPLISEFFDGKSLQDQFVAAYLVGMPVKKDQFENIKPCESEEDTGCFCSWRTFKEGFLPKYYKANSNVVATNPLNWSITEEYASKSLNKGAVLRKFDQGLWENLTDAKSFDGLLWISKPKFPGSFLILTKNYHIADYNFFYANVRANAILRAENYLKQSGRDNLLETDNN